MSKELISRKKIDERGFLVFLCTYTIIVEIFLIFLLLRLLLWIRTWYIHVEQNDFNVYVYISSSRKYFHLLEFCVENQNDACVLAHVSIRQKWSLPWRSISPLTFHTSPCSDLLAEGQIHDNNTANQQFFVKRIQLTTHNNAKVIINAPFWEEI